MKLYGIKACDTCRKALKMLQEAGREVTFVDVRDTPIDASLLRRFHETFGDKLVNTRSTTWRGLDDSERGQDPLDLLGAHPTLMKRPVIDDGTLYLGWAKDTQQALL